VSGCSHHAPLHSHHTVQVSVADEQACLRRPVFLAAGEPVVYARGCAPALAGLALLVEAGSLRPDLRADGAVVSSPSGEVATRGARGHLGMGTLEWAAWALDDARPGRWCQPGARPMAPTPALGCRSRGRDFCPGIRQRRGQRKPARGGQ
jgi:hypothetical protein